jgi:hypothetical protein
MQTDEFDLPQVAQRIAAARLYAPSEETISSFLRARHGEGLFPGQRYEGGGKTAKAIYTRTGLAHGAILVEMNQGGVIAPNAARHAAAAMLRPTDSLLQGPDALAPSQRGAGYAKSASLADVVSAIADQDERWNVRFRFYGDLERHTPGRPPAAKATFEWADAPPRPVDEEAFVEEIRALRLARFPTRSDVVVSLTPIVRRILRD